MNPTEAGQTQVFTGTLSPDGSVLASDAVAKIESNDPAVQPTLDSTQLIVSVTYPAGWIENATTPLVFSYTTSSATTSQALSATITPSAPPPPPPVLATASCVRADDVVSPQPTARLKRKSPTPRRVISHNFEERK